ncbi:helix-turn-helix domain-containing protein [Streptomyces sp. NPDC060001]|uniref:helix-turn-helix domain-containing protein n=1 Tax=Streptomyces sp. NPDC060001 TaxID=3347032 RepID=UPI0036C311B7
MATKLPADEVIALYRQGSNLRDLADRYGCAPNTIKRILERHGVPRRGSPRRPTVQLPEEDVVAAYRQGGTIAGIAAQYAVHGSAVRTLLVRSGVELRPVGRRRGSTGKSTKSKKSSLPKREVIASYKRGSTLKVLAERYGVSPSTICVLLEGEGVERRKSGDWESVPPPRVQLPVGDILQAYAAGDSPRAISGRYGVSVSTIQRRLREARSASSRTRKE